MSMKRLAKKIRQDLAENNGKIELIGLVWSENITDMCDLAPLQALYPNQEIKVASVWCGMQIATYICSGTPMIFAENVYNSVCGDVCGDDDAVQEIEMQTQEGNYFDYQEIADLFDGFNKGKHRLFGALDIQVFTFECEDFASLSDLDLYAAWDDFCDECQKDLLEYEQSNPSI